MGEDCRSFPPGVGEPRASVHRPVELLNLFIWQMFYIKRNLAIGLAVPYIALLRVL